MHFKASKKYYLIFFIIFFFHLTQAKKKKEKNQDQLYFDTIKKNYSYDPETKQWSSVESFNTIEIIEKEKKNIPHDEDKILYENFWTYNADKNKWLKKDIPVYGYSDTKYNGYLMLNKISLDISLAPGFTYYRNHIKDAQLIQREDENIFYIQSKVRNIYKIDWFESLLKKLDKRYIKINRKKNIKKMHSPTLHGIGFSVPISIIAYGNLYTKLRLGGGITGVINWINKLKLIDNEKDFKVYTTVGKKYFFNIKYFVLIAYKYKQTEKYNWIVEKKLGLCQDLGSIPHRLWKGKNIRQTLCYSLGLRTEKKIKKNNKVFSCLTLEWKSYVDTIEKNFAIYLKQPALYLEIGIGTNFNT